MPLVKQNSFDRRLKKPADDQERDLLNEHEVNKVLFPDDFLAKAIQQKLETVLNTGAKQTVVADAGTVEKRLQFVDRWETFQSNFASELQVIQRIKAPDYEETLKLLTDTLAEKMNTFSMTKEPPLNTGLRTATQDITKLDQFLQAHIQSKTAIQIIKFFTPYEAKSKQIRSIKGKLLAALLNQTVYKLLILLNLSGLQADVLVACHTNEGALRIPVVIYDNALLIRECVIYMLEILDEKQSPVFQACLQATLKKYIEKIVGKCTKVRSLSKS